MTSELLAPPPSAHAGLLDALRARCGDRVTVPGDPGHDRARRAWNLAADQRPLAVVSAADDSDVVATLEVAAAHGARVAPQATGHGALALGSLSEAVLLRLDGLRGVRVDPTRRIARVRAGTQWHEVLAAAAPHGLAPLAGSAGDVGVIGFCLNGGLSFLSRRHGLASAHVVCADVVLADGRLVHASEEEHADLLWALRGGSGSFGVVVGLELRLQAAPQLVAGALLWPIERAREVLGAWRDWCATACDRVTTSARLLRFPPDPMLPEALRGGAFVVVDGAFLGPVEGAGMALAPLRALGPVQDTWAPVGVEALAQVHMDPPVPVPASVEHVLVAEADDALLDDLVALAGAGAATSLTAVELRQLGGALAEPTPDAVVPGLDARFLLATVGVPVDAGVGAAIRDDQRLVLAAAARLARGTLATFVDAPGADAPPPPATARRLAEVKRRYDAQDVVLAAHAPA